MNVVLIGYRCSGKTEVGRALAGEMARGFIDTDELIEERTGTSIETIVAKEGWERFREIEKRLVEEVSKRDLLVVGTGGGVVVDGENIRNLKKNGWIIWLKAESEVIRERMEREERSGKFRPSLSGTSPQEEIQNVLRVRAPLYRQAGDFTVDTGMLSVREAADRILNALPDGLQR